jgi:hypothetical protein
MDEDWESDEEPPLPDGDESEKRYEVGRGKPPLHSRFKKGNPGGPGRPKGSASRQPDLLSELEEALNTKISFTENGRTTRKSLREIGTLNLAKKYAKADLPAVKLVYALMAVKTAAHVDPWEDFEKDEDGNVIITLDMGNPEVEERIRQKEIERRLASEQPESDAEDGSAD